jgi:hypothetical protein
MALRCIVESVAALLMLGPPVAEVLVESVHDDLALAAARVGDFVLDRLQE